MRTYPLNLSLQPQVLPSDRLHLLVSDGAHSAISIAMHTKHSSLFAWNHCHRVSSPDCLRLLPPRSSLLHLELLGKGRPELLAWAGLPPHLLLPAAALLLHAGVPWHAPGDVPGPLVQLLLADHHLPTLPVVPHGKGHRRPRQHHDQ